MTLQLLLFAAARQTAGDASVTIELPEGASYADLKTALAEQHPSLAAIAAVSRLAAGGAFVSDDSPVDSKVELALIPPVSGG